MECKVYTGCLKSVNNYLTLVNGNIKAILTVDNISTLNKFQLILGYLTLPFD